jgi:PAS domain S-box-containing protein
LTPIIGVPDAKRLDEQGAALLAVLDARADMVGVALVLTSADGQVTHWGHGAERIYGWSRREAEGRNVDELMGSRFARWRPFVAADGDTSWSSVDWLRHRDGDRLLVYTEQAVQFDDCGEVAVVIGASIDLPADWTIGVRNRTSMEDIRTNDTA